MSKTIKVTATVEVDDFAVENDFLNSTLYSAIEIGLKERGVSNTRVKALQWRLSK